MRRRRRSNEEESTVEETTVDDSVVEPPAEQKEARANEGIGPVAPPVVGRKAVDPLAPSSRPARMNVSLWARSKGMRPVDSAAFRSWVDARGTADRTADEWSALHAEFLRTPVGR